MIEALASGERVDLLVDDERTEDKVRSRISAEEREVPHDQER